MEENVKLAREFCREQFVSRGMIVDMAVHEGESSDPEIADNPHFHVLVPIRPMNPDGTWGKKQRREYKLCPLSFFRKLHFIPECLAVREAIRHIVRQHDLVIDHSLFFSVIMDSLVIITVSFFCKAGIKGKRADSGGFRCLYFRAETAQ